MKEGVAREGFDGCFYNIVEKRGPVSPCRGEDRIVDGSLVDGRISTWRIRNFNNGSRDAGTCEPSCRRHALLGAAHPSQRPGARRPASDFCAAGTVDARPRAAEPRPFFIPPPRAHFHRARVRFHRPPNTRR